MTTVIVLLSWAWLDRSVALWVHAHHLTAIGRQTFRPLSNIQNPLVSLGIICLALMSLRSIAGFRLSKIGALIVLSSLGVTITEIIKNGLKWIFGRPQPDNWQGVNVSFITDGEYKFHWFSGSGIYSAFPSGHMATVASVLSVLWILVPRLRICWGGIGALVASALVVSHFHFVGDVVAGAFLGASVGWAVVCLFERYPVINSELQG